MTGVVVGVSGSAESEQALDWALAEAASRDVPLTAVMAWQPGNRAPEPAQYAQLVERKREEALTILDLALRRTGISVRAQARLAEGPAADALLAAQDDADLVVLGRRGHGRVGRLVLGSVSSTVVEHATRPVTVVRRAEKAVPDAGGSPAEATPPRVLVGVDTSPPSVAALHHGAEAAARIGGVLDVVFAWQITTLAPLPGSWGWAPPIEDYEKFAAGALDACVAQAALPLPDERVDDVRADARDLALRRIAELDVEGDVAAVDLDVLDCLGGDEIFMGVGIDDSGQGGLDVIYSDAHWVLRM